MHYFGVRSFCHHNSHTTHGCSCQAQLLMLLLQVGAVDPACHASCRRVLGFLRRGNCCDKVAGCFPYLEATMFCNECRLF
jgi:hypothetical protein